MAKIKISKEAFKVLGLLTDKPQHIDIFCEKLSWPVSKVAVALGELESKGFAQHNPGMLFINPRFAPID